LAFLFVASVSIPAVSTQPVQKNCYIFVVRSNIQALSVEFHLTKIIRNLKFISLSYVTKRVNTQNLSQNCKTGNERGQKRRY